MKHVVFTRDKSTGKVKKVTDGLTVEQARAYCQKANNPCLAHFFEFTTEKNFRESFGARHRGR